MLILPIVSKNKIFNVRVSFKNSEKIRTVMVDDETLESDIIVNGRSFLKSSFKDDTTPKMIPSFIRSHLIREQKWYSITTKATSTGECDVYDVLVPPVSFSDVFDTLYGSVVLDMQKETPGQEKGKYLSFEKIGLGEVFSDERISKVRRIVTSCSEDEWADNFQEKGLWDMLQIVRTIGMFDFTIVSEATIPEDTMKNMLALFGKIQSKDTKSLNNYYNMALDNRDIYTKMAYVSKVVYDDPFNIIRTSSVNKDVQFVKSSN